MIQVNLLPDVKREYLHAQQMKHTFTVLSILASMAALAVLGLLFAYVQIVQPRHRANLQKDIDASTNELKGKNDAVEIVTVQGVLEQIPALQDKKLITSNIFSYLSSFTPKDVAYGEIKLDFSANTAVFTGQTTTLERANVLANNLKSATFTYKDGDASQSLKPFSSIVFSSLGKTEQADNGKDVGFQITLQFDPVLFSQKIKDPKITVNASSEELALPTTKPFEESTGSGAAQ
jgi:hypothetical protein